MRATGRVPAARARTGSDPARGSPQGDRATPSHCRSRAKRSPRADWSPCARHGNPRYPLELLLRVVTVSVETVKIVKGLPGLDI
jgi:hypothetical protein